MSIEVPAVPLFAVIDFLNEELTYGYSEEMLKMRGLISEHFHAKKGLTQEERRQLPVEERYGVNTVEHLGVFFVHIAGNGSGETSGPL